jgi:UDP-4-amino-4,6-dideoxy-L-N-acetyl-beta-L-altrosamine transaminase
MIKLFHTPEFNLESYKFDHLLHDKVVSEFEEAMADYAGAKYALFLNSATSAIFLIFSKIFQNIFVSNKYNQPIEIPNCLPPVVINTLINQGHTIHLTDDVDWIGNAYRLHKFPRFTVFDSAQEVTKDCFHEYCRDEDLIIFSHYPTKPIPSCDGGTIVSNDKNKIDFLRKLAYNGMEVRGKSWKNKLVMPGYKMYGNTLQAAIALQSLKSLDSNKICIDYVREQYDKNIFARHKITTDQSYHLYRVKVKNRAKLLKNTEIEFGIHYHPISELEKKI